MIEPDISLAKNSSRIWCTELSLDDLNQLSTNTMQELLGIKMIEVGADFLKSKMLVSPHCCQPHGVLHGGASVTLAETTGSMAAAMCVPLGGKCVGLEINANHITKIASGEIQCIAQPLHIGISTQVWQMRIYNKANRTICISRLTMAVLPMHFLHTLKNPTNNGEQS